jgi:hypothetical protein
MKRQVTITEDHNLGQDEWWCYWYACPNCNVVDSANGYQSGFITDFFNYCPMCGYKIIWDANVNRD